MSITIVRQTITPARNQTAYFEDFGTSAVRDDAGWYVNDTPSGKVLVLDSGWYRGTIIARAGVSSFTAAQRGVLSLNLNVTDRTPIQWEGDLGSVRPVHSASGLFHVANNDTRIALEHYYGDATADRSWVLELQVESV